MVDVYLPIEDRQILALSIPFVDIERLSLRPVKWLRSLVFTVCGVRGDLSTTPNGPPVDYDTSTLDNLDERYFFVPEGDYRIVDFCGLDDQITSNARTLRSSNFHRDIMDRDGPACVFTMMGEADCQAAHLLPKSKGDEYIQLVLQDRQHLYNLDEEPVDLTINSLENGLFLYVTLHNRFGRGSSAFLKTPNFALQPDDIPRVETGPMPSNRITLQHFEAMTSYLQSIPQFDADMRGTGTPRPSTIILDYMYGVAAYRRWGGGQEIKEVMQQRFMERYESIPIPIPDPQDFSDDTDTSLESDNSRDLSYHPPVGRKQPRKKDSDMSPEMLQAMDDLHVLSMLIKGTTPELMAAERERQAEVEELRVKEASKMKVQQWMQNSCVPYLWAISN
ncbi:uncharacterized protein LACBIDRAFT_334685 [Laccaria bicolor S238N-H82]|uniref:Predicted protein n=1 Tax=Laccaria bicolor (strain S238N-H82 / ATCC MYA-4686) TaxID=486041 RepID=B0DZY5_LACBS|nr:uncharacterized protein LACBIDRAFT_334685 [Laccaria bicolor S238N-H82]EDQ99804.1 predicted protein [Laccaria bicolor S238N-H82]|eukprot:XP_001889496.1 predicted protein [Laccaria bicolor S238N-H82]